MTERAASAGGAPAWNFLSGLDGLAWPALPLGEPAAVLGLLFQMEFSQWLARDELLHRQLLQLRTVAAHAFESVPFYGVAWRGRYEPQAGLSWDAFQALPVLNRRDIQSRSEAFHSARIPASHGKVTETHTSGSTGMPVRVLKTGVSSLFWKACTLREHLWHGRDLRGKLAAIRRSGAKGEFASWGAATEGLVATGRSVVLGVEADVDSQLAWLGSQQPDYLLTYPSNLAELARRSKGTPAAAALTRLREARTFGELLTPEVRALCREAWDVPVVDMYSADEVGYLALQCPAHEHYHVQSEHLLVEVLDDDDRPCAPGQVGRVVVTTLHNFAMPLVRYDLGDHAEVGEPCDCGRGLPVLRRIVGRTRNMLVTRAGQRFWPALGTRGITDIAPVLQYQLAQTSFESLEARLVVARPLSSEQESRLRERILSRMPAGLQLRFLYLERIPHGAGGKFEDFISEIAS